MSRPHIRFDAISKRTHFYFLRHGATEGNAKKLVQGRKDVPLSPLGEDQARQTGVWFKDKDIRRVFTSPLERSFETASVISASLTLPAPEKLPDLVELDTGALTGITFSEAAERYPDLWQTFNMKSWEGVPDAESVESLYWRAVRVWNALIDCAENGERSILAVTHAGFMQWIVKEPFRSKTWMPLIACGNCGIFHAVADPEDRTLEGKPVKRFLVEWVLMNHIAYV